MNDHKEKWIRDTQMFQRVCKTPETSYEELSNEYDAEQGRKQAMIKQPSIATIKRDHNIYVDLPTEEKLTRRRLIVEMLPYKTLKGICERNFTIYHHRGRTILRQDMLDNWSLVERDIFEWIEAAKENQRQPYQEAAK